MSIRILPLGFLIAMAMPSVAQEVTLRTENNSVQVNGELLGFDGETYSLRSSIGVLQLAAEGLICEGAACPQTEASLDFTVSGPALLTEQVLPALVAAYGVSTGSNTQTDAGQIEATFEGETGAISTSPKGSAEALDDLLNRRSDLALTTRYASEDELRAFDAAGLGALRETVLAVDGLVIVAPESIALPSISIGDVARIFAGELKNWSEVGGPDVPMNVYARAPGSLSHEVFDALVLAPQGRDLTADAQLIASDEALSEIVAADPYGIGFTLFSPDNAARQMPVIGRCGLVVSPNDFNIRAEEYPLAYRVRALTTDRNPSALLDALLAFGSSDQAQAVVSASGMTPQSLIRSSVDRQGMRFASALQSGDIIDAIPRLQAMAAEMVVSERLSSTLRFEAGSRQLDERGRRDVERVAQLLSDEADVGVAKTVRIMGFTDSLGNPALNQELSERRARQVLEALLAVDPALADKVNFKTMGFGDVSPIGCDQSVTGRWINRRVEIWISAALE